MTEKEYGREVEYSVVICPHCGNKTATTLLKLHIDSIQPIDDIPDIFDQYGIFKCPACKGILFVKHTMCIDNNENEYFCKEKMVLYPSFPFYFDNVFVPTKIAQAIETAHRVRRIDVELCFLSLRATLERICKEKGAIGKTLEEMVKDLIKREILPGMFQDLCDVIRKYGNKAAHGDEVKESDIDNVIRYVIIIIDYLYSLPQSVKESLSNIKEIEEK